MLGIIKMKTHIIYYTTMDDGQFYLMETAEMLPLIIFLCLVLKNIFHSNRLVPTLLSQLHFEENRDFYRQDKTSWYKTI